MGHLPYSTESGCRLCRSLTRRHHARDLCEPCWYLADADGTLTHHQRRAYRQRKELTPLLRAVRVVGVEEVARRIDAEASDVAAKVRAGSCPEMWVDRLATIKRTNSDGRRPASAIAWARR